MKKKSRWLVAVGLVLALVLAVAPTQVLANGVTVDPDGPYTVGVGDTFTVSINVSNIVAPGLCQVTFDLGYDNTVIEMTDTTMPFSNIVKGAFWGAAPITIGASLFPDRVRVNLDNTDCVPFPPPGSGGVTGSGCIAEIEFIVVGEVCDISELDLSSYGPGGTEINALLNPGSGKIPATWTDSSVTVEPCGTPTPTPTPKQHIVVSGKLLLDGTAKPVDPCPPLLPYPDWGVQSNDWGEWVPPGPPPGFEECDEFHPCEWVWVWGYDFDFCQTYRIWIQPYGPSDLYPAGPSVAEGQELLEALCPPDFPPPAGAEAPDPCPPPGWMPGWVDVHIDEDGKFGPVPIWHVDGEYCELWEIVADKTDIDATNPGFYGSNEDGLDAACIGEWGFHIYPEGLTIILLSLGLVAVGGYLVLRRRKGAETDS